MSGSKCNNRNKAEILSLEKLTILKKCNLPISSVHCVVKLLVRFTYLNCSISLDKVQWCWVLSVLQIMLVYFKRHWTHLFIKDFLDISIYSPKLWWTIISWHFYCHFHYIIHLYFCYWHTAIITFLHLDSNFYCITALHFLILY